MNTNPNAKRILCFGDSNTQGQMPYNPTKGHPEFYEPQLRWTGVMQNHLGDTYEVLEHGLAGRTIASDIKGNKVSLNGLKAWKNALASTVSLDTALLMIGVNNCWDEFEFNITSIKYEYEQYIKIFFDSFPGKKLIAINFPQISDSQLHSAKQIEKCKIIRTIFRDCFDSDDVSKLFYLDMSEYVQYSTKDDLHMDVKNHETFGKVMAEKVKEILD